MNLLRAELSRLAARRFVQLMVVLLIGAFGITIATTLTSSHQPSANEIAVADDRAAQQRRDQQPSYERCLTDQRFSPRSQPLQDCEAMNPERIDGEDFLYGVFVFEREIRPLMYFLVAFLALFGFLVGASYVGADLNSGGMTNLLLWRPTRMTVLGTKLGALLGAMLFGSVVASALYLSAFWTIAQTTGLPGDLDGNFWRWMGLTSGRGLTLILGVTALGFAIATLGRHTAAALGAVAAYAIVWEVGARIVLDIVEARRPELWMMSTYVGAWMSGDIQLWDRHACSGTGFGYCDGEYTLTWVHGAAVLGALFVGFAVGAFANFRRRDLA
ncbi:MAG TPA: ABC transporter permease subunit [Micromonosporaceae bacterium]|nr:ABC transporter permease subunit [Micromonosporaceae bacterium]